MTRTTGARPTAAALVLLAAASAAAVASAGTPAAAVAEPDRTTLTFTVADCEGCTVQLQRGRATEDAQPKVWTSGTRTVEDGQVSFTVRSARTFGMSVLVRAPWEGHTGYVTTVAMRYDGHAVGDAVTFEGAREQSRASACWEGTRQDEVTLPLVVREVMVPGVHERVPGSIAFVEETQSWLDPVRRARKGVLGSQDANVCR